MNYHNLFESSISNFPENLRWITKHKTEITKNWKMIENNGKLKHYLKLQKVEKLLKTTRKWKISRISKNLRNQF